MEPDDNASAFYRKISFNQNDGNNFIQEFPISSVLLPDVDAAYFFPSPAYVLLQIACAFCIVLLVFSVAWTYFSNDKYSQTYDYFTFRRWSTKSAQSRILDYKDLKVYHENIFVYTF
jgi:hypothetical protein